MGNPETVSIREWVKFCYDAVGAPLETVCVIDHPQRSFFPFHEYEYFLDVSRQMVLMPELKSLKEGLREEWAWFREHRQEVFRKPLTEYIDAHILP